MWVFLEIHEFRGDDHGLGGYWTLHGYATAVTGSRGHGTQQRIELPGLSRREALGIAYSARVDLDQGLRAAAQEFGFPRTWPCVPG